MASTVRMQDGKTLTTDESLVAGARAAYARALELVHSEAERRSPVRQLAELEG